jgi:hypothetical protein
MPATGMTAAKARMSRETAAMAAAGVTPAMLRPQGQRQEKHERRNRHRATHTESIRLIVEEILSKFVSKFEPSNPCL